MLIFAVKNDKDLLWYRYFTFLVANNRGVLVMYREIIEDILFWCFLHSRWTKCNTLQTIFLSLLLFRFKISILVFRSWRFISYSYCSLSMLSYMCDQMMILKLVMNNRVSKFFRKFPFMRSVLRVFCGAVYFAVWLTHHCFLHHKKTFWNKKTWTTLFSFRYHKLKRSQCQTRWSRCQHWRSWGLCCTILVRISLISKEYLRSHNQLEKSVINDFSN